MANHFKNTALSAGEDQHQIYVVCLSSYNNGILHGAWINATQDSDAIQEQIKQLLAKSSMPGAEEFAVHDYMGFGSLELDEYESIEEIQAKAVFIVEHGELGEKVIAHYSGDIEYAKEALEEYYQGEYESALDYAACLFDELYLHGIPKPARGYINYEDYQKDIFIDDYFSLDVTGCRAPREIFWDVQVAKIYSEARRLY